MIIDHAALGVSASHRLLAAHEPRADWVWCLDDDDECADIDLVRRVHAVGDGTDVIMVKMDHGPELGILPDALVWGQRPVEGHLGISSYIVRGEVWRAHRRAWGSCRYASDFDFIASVFGADPSVQWIDVVASRTQDGRHLGAA